MRGMRQWSSLFVVAAVIACDSALATLESPLMARSNDDWVARNSGDEVARSNEEWVGRTYQGSARGMIDGQPFATTFTMTFTTRYDVEEDLAGTWTAEPFGDGTFQVEMTQDGRLLLDLYDGRQCIYVGAAEQSGNGQHLRGEYSTPEGSICTERVTAEFELKRR